MTPYIFLAVFGLSIVLTLARPIWGVYAYALIFYFTPYRTWWEDEVPDLRYLQIIAIVTLFAAMLHGCLSAARFRRVGGEFKLFAALVAFMCIASLWAITGELHADGRILFLKHLLISLLIILLLDTWEQLRSLLLVHVVGGLWLGYQAYGKSGGRLEGIAGALGDSNTLGMHMGALAIIAGLMFLASRRYYRWISFLALPLIINTIVLTSSRGATVGLVAGGIIAGLLAPRKILPQFAVAGVLGVIMIIILSDAKFLERLASLDVLTGGETEEVNKTSGNRIDIALAGLEMWKDHPMGVGYKGTKYLSTGYMSADLLTGDGMRSAHNSLMGVLVDFGLVGLSLYLLLYARLFLHIRRINRAVKPDELEFGATLAGVGGALGLVFVSGQAGNYYYAEIQYWMLAIFTVAARLYAQGDHREVNVIHQHAPSGLDVDPASQQQV